MTTSKPRVEEIVKKIYDELTSLTPEQKERIEHGGFTLAELAELNEPGPHNWIFSNQ